MKFSTLLTSLAVLASGAYASCAEASRFGDLIVTPSVLAPGDSFTVSVNYSCAIDWFGIIPTFQDFYIEVPTGNNGFEPNILLARRNYTNDPSTPPMETFTTSLPHYPYIAGPQYVVMLTITYPVPGTDGSPVLIQGGIEFGVDINTSS